MSTPINTKIGGYYFTQLNDNELEIKQSMKHKENNNIPVAFGLIIFWMIILKVAISISATKFADSPILSSLPVIIFVYFVSTLPIQKIIFINRQTKTFTALTFNLISKLTMGKFFVGKKQSHFSSFKTCVIKADDNLICFMVDNELIGFTGAIKKSEEREKVCDIINGFVSKLS